MPAAKHACSSSQLAPVQRTVSIPPRAAAVVPAVPRRGRWLAPERAPQHAAAAAAAGASRAGASPAAELDVDVCILGAGIIGLCTALALLRSDPRLSVALLDRQAPCAGATGAGQGYLWLAHRDVGSPLFRLAAHSRDMWRQLLAPVVPELTTAAVEWQVRECARGWHCRPGKKAWLAADSFVASWMSACKHLPLCCLLPACLCKCCQPSCIRPNVLPSHAAGGGQHAAGQHDRRDSWPGCAL